MRRLRGALVLRPGGVLARLEALLATASHGQRSMAAASAPSSGKGRPPNEPGVQEFEYDAATMGQPVKVHQLIGDPRTGVADDTTTNPWGDMTAEQVRVMGQGTVGHGHVQWEGVL